MELQRDVAIFVWIFWYFAGFYWDRVKFFHSTLYGLMFGICDENSDDITGIFYLFIPE